MRKRQNSSGIKPEDTKKTLFSKKFRGISSIEYAFLFIVLAAAFIGMAVYFKRAISGRWRQTVDDAFGKGRQYDPYATEEIDF